MAKQTVNLGSSANDGTGDPLRTAFDKINDNFDELYLYSTVTSGNNVTITGNTIATDNTNGNLTLDPNGTGKVIIATSAEMTFNTHVDNAIMYVAPDGDVSFSSSMTYKGNTVTLEDITMAGGTLGTGNSNQELVIDPSGTGAIKLKGDTDVTGAVTVSTTLGVTGATTLSSTLSVAGTTTLTGSFKPAIHTFTATDAVTEVEHAGRTLLLGEVGGNALVTLTLPAATGSGNIYRFIVSVVNTSNYVIKVADATDTIAGSVILHQDSADTVVSFNTAATSDTITLNGTTTGGVSIGDELTLTDIATNQYVVKGVLTASGTEATPFSATVS